MENPVEPSLAANPPPVNPTIFRIEIQSRRALAPPAVSRDVYIFLL
jgi:hypothetical protein